MIAKLQERFSYMEWYFKSGKTLIITIPFFIDVIIVSMNAMIYAFSGLAAMAKMGGFIIFLLGIGFVFPMFPIILALVYSKLPIIVDEKLQSKYLGIPLFNRYFIITLAMVAMRVGIIFGIYGYNLITIVK